MTRGLASESAWRADAAAAESVRRAVPLVRRAPRWVPPRGERLFMYASLVLLITELAILTLAIAYR